MKFHFEKQYFLKTTGLTGMKLLKVISGINSFMTEVPAMWLGLLS